MNKIVKNEADEKFGDALGGLSGLLDYMEEGGTPDSSPLKLPLSEIDEDPNQPRRNDNPGFSKKSIDELAETIKQRGVKTPISVRKLDSGRYMVNHGARRLRAAKVAGLSLIPAYVDGDYTDVDQVIENLQRDDLTAREIAEFIGRQLAKGQKKGAIAKSIGRSAAFVSHHVALLDLPDSIDKLYRLGLCRDVTVLYELVVARKKDAEAVDSWLKAEDGEITRSSVRGLKGYIKEKANESKSEIADQASEPLGVETVGNEQGSVDGELPEGTEGTSGTQANEQDTSEVASSEEASMGTDGPDELDSSEDAANDRPSRGGDRKPPAANQRGPREAPLKNGVTMARLFVRVDGEDVMEVDLRRRPSARDRLWLKCGEKSSEGAREVLMSEAELFELKFD